MSRQLPTILVLCALGDSYNESFSRVVVLSFFTEQAAILKPPASSLPTSYCQSTYSHKLFQILHLLLHCVCQYFTHDCITATTSVSALSKLCFTNMGLHFKTIIVLQQYVIRQNWLSGCQLLRHLQVIANNTPQNEKQNF